MKYFFPGPIIGNEGPLSIEKEYRLQFCVDSGKSALRIALRVLNLEKGSTIGIASYCCNSAVDAIYEEGYSPYFFDLFSENTFWSNYEVNLILNNKINVIILVHLYGSLHPQTKEISDFCMKNNISLIQDCAQSFGINEERLGTGAIVYSFGPGKSSTAALGGELKNADTRKIEITKPGIKRSIQSYRFYFNRKYDYSIWLDKLFFLAQSFFSKSPFVISKMTPFQKRKALEAKKIVLLKSEERKERLSILKKAVLKNSLLKFVNDDRDSLGFKCVIYLNNNVMDFVNYLEKSDVPFSRLGPDIRLDDKKESTLINFYANYQNFIELSTERSIPLIEIGRVAQVLEAYKI